MIQHIFAFHLDLMITAFVNQQMRECAPNNWQYKINKNTIHKTAKEAIHGQLMHSGIVLINMLSKERRCKQNPCSDIYLEAEASPRGSKSAASASLRCFDASPRSQPLSYVTISLLIGPIGLTCL